MALERVNTLAYGAAISLHAESRRAVAGARIGRSDWIRAAMAALVRDGIAGVRVEPLALKLKVTKGSFYWHFKDRAALHEAMLEHWRAVATRAIMVRVDAGGGSAREKLRRLIELTAPSASAARLETAMRGWARHDAKVSDAIAAADRERIGYVAGLLRENGLSSGAAESRARLLYLAVIGSYFSAGQRVAGRSFWREIEALIAMRTVRKPR